MRSVTVKTELLKQIAIHLRTELESLKKSAETARDAATNEESKPENKYDTRGLEASYLAGAQQVRANEIETKLQQLAVTILPDFGSDAVIAATALVELKAIDSNEERVFFVFNLGAGYQLTLGNRPVTCISTHSPVGRTLLGKGLGDFIQIGNDQNQNSKDKEFEIINIS